MSAGVGHVVESLEITPPTLRRPGASPGAPGPEPGTASGLQPPRDRCHVMVNPNPRALVTLYTW